MNKKIGFTLSEILIALTVVGIVSAITVPTLMNKSTKKTQAALIQKTHLEISDAVELYMNDKDYKSVKAAFADLAQVSYFLTTYFRVNKNCGTSPKGECLSTTYGDMKGATGLTSGPYSSGQTTYTCIQNKAGVTICMNAVPTGKVSNSFYVDTNGPGEPNIKGRDIFAANIYKDGTIEDNGGYNIGDYSSRNSAFESGCNASGSNVFGCLGKLMNDNWVMNY